MATERLNVKPGAGFDPTNKEHVQQVLDALAKAGDQGTGWQMQSYNPESGMLTLQRQSAVTQVLGSGKRDSYEVALMQGTKPADGEKVAAQLESDPSHAGYFLTKFDPYIGTATLSRMTLDARRCRAAVATQLGVKPWDVQVTPRPGGGFRLGLPNSYVPSKHDSKLQEVADSVIGRLGWYFESNASKLTAEIIPADPPVFEPVYQFNFSALPARPSMDDPDLWRIPLGESLGGRGVPNTPLVMDLADSVGSLTVGLAGSGKAQPLSSRVPVPVQDRFPDGWAQFGDLRPGDLCFAGDGSVDRIIGLSDTYLGEVYEVELSDGQVIRTHENHVWKVSNVVSRSAHTPKMTSARTAHREEYLERARKVREMASTADARVGATLSDIARLLCWSENALYRMDLPIRHLAKTVTLVGAPGPARTVYPIDEVLNLVAERIERLALTDRRGRQVTPEETLVTTAEMMGSLRYGKAERANWAVRTAGAVEGPDAPLPVPPYVLGAWLGDGTSRSGTLTSADPDIIENIEREGYTVRRTTTGSGKASNYAFEGLYQDLNVILSRVPGARSKLDKRIPAEYLRASRAQRLALLQGLMDTDGTIQRSGACELSLSKADLAHDALELIRSLGIKARIREAASTYRDAEGVVVSTGTRYRITFTTEQAVFRLARKARRLPLGTRSTQDLLYVVDVRRTGQYEPMRCIKVNNPEHLYLTDGFVPTHNSVATQAVLFSAMARGWDIALINTADKATDFAWAKPYVKENMWGCDSVAQAVTVAKLVGEEGSRRGELLSRYGVSKWQDLPADVRGDNPPLLLVADELAALLTADPLPSGLTKEMKELPEFIQMQQDLLESKLLATALSTIPAVYRAAGIRVNYLTQQPNERYGFSTKLKGNLPHRVMLGVNPSQAEKGHAFRTPEKVPDVPSHIAQNDKLSRGVGLAHLDGQEPVVFKGYFAHLETYIAEARRRGFRTTSHPEPTSGQIARLVPRIDGEEGEPVEVLKEQKKYGTKPRKAEDMEAWELDPETGKPLSGFARANAGRSAATVAAKQP